MTAEPTIPAEEAKRLLSVGKGWPGMRVRGMLKPERPINLPSHLHVEALDLSTCRDVESLPKGLTCFELNASNTAIRELPADLQVESILNLSNCDKLRSLPRGLTVGALNIRGC